MQEKGRTRKAMQGEYILAALRQHFLGGDSYIMSNELYGICRQYHKNLNYDVFERDYTFLLQNGKLHR